MLKCARTVAVIIVATAFAASAALACTGGAKQSKAPKDGQSTSTSQGA